MAKRDHDVLAEIERDRLDEPKSVASALLKCVALGGHGSSAELRERATRELRGYPGREDQLPDYYHVRAPLVMDGMNGGAIIRGESVSVIDLPEVCPRRLDGCLYLVGVRGFSLNPTLARYVRSKLGSREP